MYMQTLILSGLSLTAMIPTGGVFVILSLIVFKSSGLEATQNCKLE